MCILNDLAVHKYFYTRKGFVFELSVEFKKRTYISLVYLNRQFRNLDVSSYKSYFFRKLSFILSELTN